MKLWEQSVLVKERAAGCWGWKNEDVRLERKRVCVWACASVCVFALGDREEVVWRLFFRSCFRSPAIPQRNKCSNW